MKRRDVIALAAAWIALAPSPSKAQQSAIPVIGFLSALSETSVAHQTTAFRRGLSEVDFVEGKSVMTEYRWADGQYDRLPAMAGELVRRPVQLLIAQAPPAALAARVATTSIPIVFIVGFDPVAAGLVNSFNLPGGNATGMALITGPLGQKRIELLRELAPKARTVAVLANPYSPDAVPEIREVQSAAQANSLHITMYNASTVSEIDAAFVAMAGRRPDALLIGSDPFFLLRREQVVALAARLGVPAVYPFREFVGSGGLISYGTNIANAYRQAGIYAGRILKGAKPADLPVMQPNKFELVINLSTAKTLGTEIPPTLHARSDEVIE